MPVDNTTTFDYNQNSLAFNAGTSDAELENTAATQSTKSPTPINNDNGIVGTPEVIAQDGTEETSQVSFYSTPTIQAPDVEISDVAMQPITLNPIAAAIIGTDTMTMSDFIDFCLDAIDTAKADPEDTSPVANMLRELDMDGEGVEFLCLLLTQNSKSELVKTLKNVLKSKINDRKSVNDEYITKQKEIADQNVQNAKAQAKKKKLGIFKAIFSAIVSVVTAVVTVAMSVATFGAATPAAVVLTGLAIAGAVAMCASSAMSVAAAFGAGANNKAFQNAMMGLAIAGAVLMLAGSIGSGISSARNIAKAAAEVAEETAKTVGRGFKIASNIIMSTSGAAQAGVAIYEGVQNLELAKMQKKLDELNIQLTELDKVIQVISQFIEAIQESVQMLIMNVLQDMEKVVALLNQVMSAQLQTAATPA